MSIKQEKKFNMNKLTRTAVLLSLALVFQIGLNQFAQPLVGPMVNMTLLIAAVIVGTLPAVLIGCLTPLVAFVLGIMPLFPVVPFIMVGNAIYILIFNSTRNNFKSYSDVIGVVFASILKFAFLSSSIRYLVTLFVPKVPPKMVTALSIPQLYTALIGGFIAILLLKYMDVFLKNNKSSI